MGSPDVPDQPLAMIMNGNFTPVPTFLGSNLEEGIQFVYQVVTDAVPIELYPGQWAEKSRQEQVFAKTKFLTAIDKSCWQLFAT